MKQFLILNHCIRDFVIIIALLLLLSCTNKKELFKQTGLSDSSILLSKGFSAVIVADSLGTGRHIVVNSNGDIYVSLSSLKNGKGIVGLRDVNFDGKADSIIYFGSLIGTGLGIYNGYIYFGSDTSIVRYKLIPGKLLPNLVPDVIAHGFHLSGEHGAKSFTIDNNGNLYVNVGAPSNACQFPDRTLHTPGENPCPLMLEYGGIWRFNANITMQDQMKDGYRFATGLRNCVALRWNPVVNKLYAVQQGRDQLHELWPEYYTEDQGVNLPAEEFFLLKDGSNCGWPYTYYDDFKSMKMLAPEYGGDGKIGDNTGAQLPIAVFPAHYAPNDLLFYTGNQFPERYRNGAFIAFHGSWNRAPHEQKGYNVVFIPFRGELPSGGWEVFADNFAGVVKINDPGQAKHRPCGLAQGPDGSLYVVEDVHGKVWKIIYH